MDLIICLSAYITTVIYTMWFALRSEIASDRLTEYDSMLQGVEINWIKHTESITNSCLMVTMLPYYLHRLLKIRLEITFRAVPCFFYSLFPVFAYLIARQYYSPAESLMALVFILVNFYFLYNPNMGRNSVSMGILSGLFWALLTDKFILAGCFAVVLIFSHYGTTYITIFVLCVSSIALMFIDYHLGLKVGAVMFVLILGVLIWYNRVVSLTGNICTNFVKSSLINDLNIKRGSIFSKYLNPSVDGMLLGEADKKKRGGFFSLESREIVVQVAFGRTFPYMNTPQRIEFFLSWLVVLVFSYGYILSISRYDAMHLSISSSLFFLILLTIVVPSLSVYYGIARVYFTALTAMAPCFIIGIVSIAGYIQIDKYILAFTLLGLHGLCISGLMHWLFRINKRRK